MSAPTRSTWRRRAIAASGCVLALLCVASLAATPLPTGESGEALNVRTYPIETFSLANPQALHQAAPKFLGGIEVAARHREFGGISGLVIGEDGLSFIALTDHAQWLTGRLQEKGGRLVGVEALRLAPMLGPGGEPMSRSRSYDAEGLARIGGDLLVSTERTNELFRFDWGARGPLSRARPVPVPRGVKSLPRTRGLEAIGVMPARSRLAGAIIAIAERSGDAEAPTRGFLIGGPRPGEFELIRHDRFDITDLAFLPGGDMLVLERWFSPLRGLAVRLRRIALAEIAPGALLDGPVILSADLGDQIDNLEGLAIHRAADGAAILTLVSDDNFSILQRTLFLRFAYQE